MFSHVQLHAQVWRCFCCAPTNCTTPNASTPWRWNFFIRDNVVAWKEELAQQRRFSGRCGCTKPALLQHRFSCASARNTWTISPACCDQVSATVWINTRAFANTWQLQRNSSAAESGWVQASSEFLSGWNWCNIVLIELHWKKEILSHSLLIGGSRL